MREKIYRGSESLNILRTSSESDELVFDNGETFIRVPSKKRRNINNQSSSGSDGTVGSFQNINRDSHSNNSETNEQDTLKCFYWPRFDPECPCMNCELKHMEQQHASSSSRNNIANHKGHKARVKIRKCRNNDSNFSFSKIRQNLMCPLGGRLSF